MFQPSGPDHMRQLYKIHIHNTVSESEFRLTTRLEINIARGTTDPGYWLFNLSYLSS